MTFSSSTLPSISSYPAHRHRLGASRFWISLAITVFWLATMTLLALHERARSGAGLRRIGVSLDVLRVSWSTYDSWMWIDQDGRHIGVSRLTIAAEPEDLEGKPRNAGYTLTSIVRIRLPLLAFNLPVAWFLRMDLNDAFEMTTIQGVLQALGHSWLCQGFVEGNRLYYRLLSKGGAPAPEGTPPMFPEGEQIGMAPLNAPIMMGDSIVPIVIQSERFKSGEKWKFPVASPFIGRLDTTLQVRVEGRETIELNGQHVDAWKMSQRLGGLESKAWYDQEGHLLRQDMNGGLRMEQATPDKALEFEPWLRSRPALDPLDREYIKTHVDPALRGKPLQEFLPQGSLF